jgi:hypothetical protein
MLINPFSANVATAMMGDQVNVVLAVEILFDSGPTRVHSGTGNVVIEGNNYIGLGMLGQVDSVKEQNNTSATQLNLTLAGLDSSMLATVLNENCVGRKASMFVGVLDDDFLLTDYDVVFRGKIRNTALIAGSKGAINVTVSNIFEEWARAKAWRYTDESQRQLHDDDRIFRYVAQMADYSIYWGSKKDAPPFRYVP